MGDYVGDATQYPNSTSIGSGRMTPTKGWNVNGLWFFICSSAQLGVKPRDRFWRVISQNACFWKCGLEQQYHNFMGSKSPKTVVHNFMGSKSPKTV